MSRPSLQRALNRKTFGELLPRTHSRSDLQSGFTLIEMSIALLLLILLTSSLLIPLETQVDQRKIAETELALRDIQEAIIGFTLTYGYLPCPAISATNGLEDRAGNVCSAGKRQGFLPWQSLGMNATDAWGQLFRYSVSPNFTSSAISGNATFTLNTLPDINIRTRTSTGAINNLTNSASAIAVVISHGKNGYGGTTLNGNIQALPNNWSAVLDEFINATDSSTFFSRTIQSSGTIGLGGAFDDHIIWIPRYTIMNRMVAAGKLP